MTRSVQLSLTAGAAFLAATLAAGSGAMSAPFSHAKIAHGASSVVTVHQDWRDEDDDRWERRRHYRHDHDRDVVDAPFTRVETGRRVIVDAPFAHVYVGRHGRHVVAPFVNLWVPR